MSARRDLAWLGLLALAVNAGAAWFTRQPAYMDAYYYFNGALQLARGLGFTEPYVWNYLAPVRGLPAPSHLYWMPLTSLVAAPFLSLAEWAAGARLDNAALFRAAQIPMLLAASALPLLTYAIARSATGVRRHAVAAALLTLFSAFYFPFWATTDSFALFGLCAAGALWAGARSLEVSVATRPAVAGVGLAVSGVLAGLAHLARADGVLVLLCLLSFCAINFITRRLPPAACLLPPVLLIAGYGLIMAPWFARNLLAVGAPLAPGGSRALWLTAYEDLFTYAPGQLTITRYLAQGWGAILASKGEAFAANLQSLVATQANIITFPFLLVGAWRLRHQAAFQLAGLYGAALFAAMTLAFTFPGVRGGYFHSGAALLPCLYPAALAGLDAAVDAAARRLKHWQPEKSKPVFTALLVLAGLALTAVVWIRSVPAAQGADLVYAEIGAWLSGAEAGHPQDERPSAGRAAVNNPPAFYYHTGRPAIVVPAGDEAALVQAMDDFRARWLVLDVNVAAGLRGLYVAPAASPDFRLRATFQDAAGRDVYVLERAGSP